VKAVEMLTSTSREIDVLSSTSYLRGLPLDDYRWLRREAPVFRQRIADPHLVDEAWVISRHDDVTRVELDEQHFTAKPAFTLHRRPVLDKTHLLNTDGDEHAQLRRKVGRGLTPRVVEVFTEKYAQLVTELLDHVPFGEPIDFAREVAAELPALAICELMGAPAADRAQVVRCANAMGGDADPEYAGSGAAVRQHFRTFLEIVERLVEQKAREPGNDLVSTLVAERDAGSLTHDELTTFVVLLLGAGAETVRNNIAQGLLALVAHPEQTAILRDGGVTDAAVNEITRWATPVIYIAKSVAAEVEMHGCVLQPGERVAVLYGSANRDESTFTDPDQFDVTRDPNPLLSFGFGPHYCIGAALARLETKVMFTQLLARTSTIKLCGPVDRLQSSFQHGIKHLPVVLGRGSTR
jgi:cholest-4-en-3-one 26-monooxygenase